jgi:dephospho-CoA kinase
LAVDADPHIRYERISHRKSALDNVSYEKFLFDEKREMLSKDPTEGSISDCMKLADYQLVNDSTKEELYRQIDTFLEGIEGRKRPM